MGLLNAIGALFSSSKPSACQSCEINAVLDNASWLARDNAARDIVNGLSDKELRALPTKDKARLAEELSGGVITSDDKAALAKLYRNLTPADYQPPSDVVRQRKLVAALAADETIKDAKKNWAGLSYKKRQEALQKAADLHAECYNLPKKPLKFKDLKDMSNCGYYSPLFGHVVISNHVDPETKKSILDDASEAFDTVVHENTHRYQSKLIRDLDNGTIKETDDTYNQARLMRANRRLGAYAEADGDPEAYVNQPEEAHAWRVGGSAR